jgi:membrane protease YdiL (CAAX protease family)
MTAESEMLPPAATAPQPIAGWVLLAAPLLGVVFFAVLLIGAVAAMALSGGLDLSGGAQAVGRRISGNYVSVMGIGALLYLAALASAWLLLPKKGPASLASYFPPVPGRTLLIAAGAGILLVLFILPAIGIISSAFHVDLESTPAERALLPHSLVQLAALLAMGAVVAPLVEEVYFRGLFLRWLRKRLGITAAAVINVVIFAVMHGRFLDHPGVAGVVATAGLCVPAIVLVAFAVRTGSLWPGFIVHAVYNGTLLALSYFAPNVG